ncbi:Transmembrane protein 70 [Mactra antiquata]
MSTLGKLCRNVRFSGKQTASLLLEGPCNVKSTSKLYFVQYQQSHNLHLKTNGSVILRPFVVPLYQTRYASNDNNIDIDEESKLPLTHPTKGTLVYFGRLSPYTKRLKILSLTTSALAAFAQPFILSAARDDMLIKAGILATLASCVLATPFAVHFVTKKYVTDIYFNSDTKVFTLTTRGFFLQKKELEYKAEDVEFPFVPRAFVSHLIKGKSFFIEECEFRGKEIYMHMVGFDKEFTLQKGQKKKFGIFDGQEEEKKVESKSDVFVPPRIAFYDDDDGDSFIQQKREKEKKKVNSK